MQFRIQVIILGLYESFHIFVGNLVVITILNCYAFFVGNPEGIVNLNLALCVFFFCLLVTENL